MSGPANFTGTTYQQAATALIEVHILAQKPLGWLPPSLDIPNSISVETGGPGDDVGIDFGGRTAAAEAQVKHGLTITQLREAIAAVRSRSTGSSTRVVFVIDRTSTRHIWRQFPTGLDHVRQGHLDLASSELAELINEFGDDLELFKRIHIVDVDLDRPHHGELKSALETLEFVLVDPNQRDLAWETLVADAGRSAARRWTRTRSDIVAVLERNGVKVRPLGKNDPMHRRLDFTRDLLKKHHAAAALTQLHGIEAEITADPTYEPRVGYRLAALMAYAFLLLDQYADSLVWARRALDIDPSGSVALANASAASLLSGEIATARAFAERAIKAHPHEPDSWIAMNNVADAESATLPEVPADVASNPQFRVAQAHQAARRQNWARVLQLTQQLLVDNSRTPDVLYLRSNALANASEAVASEHSSDRWADVERFSSELIEALADDAHPLTVLALVMRSSAKRNRGDFAGSAADLGLARRLDSGEPNMIGHSAQAQIENGNWESALHILRHPTVDSTPKLLTLRARVLIKLGDEASSKTDVLAALRQAADAQLADEIRQDAADIAIELGDVSLAEQTLGSIKAKLDNDARFHATSARLALAKSDFESGTAHFRRAAELAPRFRPDYMSELAGRLLSAKQFEAAAAVFRELDLDKLPQGAYQAYAVVMMRVDDLVAAKELLDRLPKTGSLPDWALGLATDLAERQEDVETAIAHLSELVGRETAKPSERIELCRHLIATGRLGEATTHVDALLKANGLSPVQTMQIAQLLHLLDRMPDAVPLALRAFRRSAEDPQLHRALISMMVTSRYELPRTELVAVNTHVVLRDDDGDPRLYTIYHDQPIEPMRHEILLKDAEKAGLIGKRVGDVIVQDAGQWTRRELTVESIVPAVLHVVQDAMAHYEERFPNEPFFMKKFKIGDGTSVKAFMPMIASLESRKKQVAEMLALYQKELLPLGFVVKRLGGSMADVMQYLTSDAEIEVPLLVEWSNANGQRESQDAAATATIAILTRSALETADALGLLDTLSAVFTLVAPLALREELRRELKEAQHNASEGMNTLMSAGPAIRAYEMAAGAPALKAIVEKLECLLAFVETKVRCDPRPLETIKPTDSQEEQVRDMVGLHSYDSFNLAQHLNASLYADDLGLRRFLPLASRQRSFSSIGLLNALTQKGILTPSQRDASVLRLVAKHYAFVQLTVELLELAIREHGGRGESELAKVFGLLSSPTLSVDESARLVGRLLKRSIVAEVQVLSPERMAWLALEVMSLRWPPRLCAQSIARAASHELKLLPQQLKNILELCVRFADLADPLPKQL